LRLAEKFADFFLLLSNKYKLCTDSSDKSNQCKIYLSKKSEFL
jgi:hypothetical protein